MDLNISISRIILAKMEEPLSNKPLANAKVVSKLSRKEGILIRVI